MRRSLTGARTLFRHCLSPTLCVLSMLPVSSLAQTVDAIGTVGIGSRGSESELARSEARLMLGGQAGVLWDGRLETAVRATWFDRPERTGASTYYFGSRSAPEPLRVLHTPGDRVLLTGQVTYHFRRGASVHPFLGAGLGVIHDREDIRCEVPGCEALLPGLTTGRLTSTAFDLAAIGGVAVVVSNHVVLRGGLQLHCPLCEETSVLETFFDVGYRFGSR